MEKNTVSIIGAGTMGRSIALNLSCFGYDVILVDISKAILEEAINRIKKEYRMMKMVKPLFNVEPLDEIISRIKITDNINEINNIDIIIENVDEDWKVKVNVYGKLARLNKDGSIICANTSCIPITKLGNLVPNSNKVIGTHFMNPASINDFVEVIKGVHTDDNTISEVKKLIKSINKRWTVINDSPGFVSNRLSHLLMNEAAHLVYEGIGTPQQIDIIMKHGYSHKMGPLETADLIGVDTVVKSLEVLYDIYKDSKYICCPLLTEMVKDGKLGRKVGEGFYEY